MKLAGLVLVGLASGCFGDAMTGPRRIQRQGRSQENSPMDWEYGGWKPLQTPKGFYRRISRNLLKDDESRLLNEVGADGDLEASSSSKLYHAQALEDFLKSGPECGGCGFQPMLLNNRAERRVRSAAPTHTINNPQRIGSHQEDIISITDALKQKLRDRNIRKRGRRDANQISASVAAASSASAETSDAAKDDALDQAKIEKISQDVEEPHFLSPKALLDLTTKLAQAIAAKQPAADPEPATDAAQHRAARTSDENPHFLSPASAAAVEKKILEALVKNPPVAETPTSVEKSSAEPTEEKPASTDASRKDEPHFLSPGAIYGVLKGISEAAAKSERPTEARSRMKRQIWNPFRRRQPSSKPAGGPFGFVNQNVPYEAQSSIDNFNFAQSIPQSSFQGNGFQGLQAFVPAHPPITNFDKVSSIDFPKPLPSQEFGPPPYVGEPEVVPPVPTRQIKRPEQVKVPKRSNSPSPLPPHVIDGILHQFQQTGQFPPDLSPETALLIADILSGKKQNVDVSAPTIDVPPPYVESPKPVIRREPAPLPDFHTKPLASPPVSFGSLPAPPPKSAFHGISRNKATPIATSHSTSQVDIVPHGHDGVHLNSEGFQRPHTVTTVTTRKRKKPLPPLTGTKLSLAEKTAEHSVEKDHHASIFPQEHVHIHHHHKKKKKNRPTLPPAIHLPATIPTAEILSAPPEHTVSEIHEHSHHDSSLNAKVHLDTKAIHGPALSLEAELGADTKPQPVTVDPLQSLDEVPAEKPELTNAEYYDDIFQRKTTSTPTTTQAPLWPVDDPFLNPSTSTEGPQTVGPEDILIQDAKPGIPMMASDLNSLKIKTKSSGPVESLPQPVFRPDIQTKKANEAAKQATQDEDDISAGAGAIHFQPIQTKEGESNSATGNAQLYHAYYAPAHHDPPPGYIRMTVDEFNKLFKDAEIQFIGSEQELQKKLGTKPTNKLNFDITKESKEDGKDSKDESGKELKDEDSKASTR